MANERARDARREALLSQLRAAGGRALSLRDLMQRARLHPGERTEVKRLLRDLARDGKLLRDGKRFSLPAATPGPPDAVPITTGGKRSALGRRPGLGVVGTLTRHRDGYGFVARLDRKGGEGFVP